MQKSTKFLQYCPNKPFTDIKLPFVGVIDKNNAYLCTKKTNKKTMKQLQASIKELAQQYHTEVVAIRRHIHANPELSFEEHQTSQYVQQKLQEYGIPFQNGIADTGIVALIEGKNPHRRVVALRADMDALPILEENNVPYKSQKAGVMHACGHDAHTANLLIAGRILHQLRHHIEGTIKLIFQPAEEKSPGGASIMIQEGVLENPRPDSIIGLHVYPLLPAGEVGFRSGMMMASSDEVYLSIKGKGGHGAVPQHSIDPVAIACQIVTALQQIVSRQNDPTVPCVLTFGKIYSVGGSYNVIPEEVKLEGTHRTMNETWRAEAKNRIRNMVEGIATAMGAQASVNFVQGYPFLVNDDALTQRCQQAAQQYLGKDNVTDLPMRMTAEDFAYYSQVAKGCFFRIGTANFDRGITSNIHTPTFDIDEQALLHSTGLMAWLAICELEAVAE